MPAAHTMSPRQSAMLSASRVDRPGFVSSGKEISPVFRSLAGKRARGQEGERKEGREGKGEEGREGRTSDNKRRRERRGQERKKNQCI